MRLILAPAAVIVAFAASVPALAATRSYTITSFDTIRVEGPYAVSVRVGGASFARASGAQRGVDAVSLRVEGRTLYVRADRSTPRSAFAGGDSAGSGPVVIAVGTPDLAQAMLNGAGSLAIDRLRRLEFVLTISGSGSASVARAELDRLRVSLSGAGAATIAGRAKQFSATVRGAGSLDAGALASRDATLSVLGPASVKASVSNSAKVTASGTAAVALTGGAACELKVSGSASVTGCR